MPGWKWNFRHLKWKRLWGYPNHSVFPNSLSSLWALQLLDDSHCWEADLQTSLSLCPTASDTFRVSLLHAGAGCSPWEHTGHSMMLKCLVGMEVVSEGKGCCKPSGA